MESEVMCGRFSQFKEFREIRLRFNPDGPGSDAALFAEPRYNIAPSQVVPVVLREGGRRLRAMRWGLVPAWANDETPGQKLINARCETLVHKPSFKGLLSTRRCLVPATGFYEWAKAGTRKVPMHFTLKSDELFAFAGLWDRWRAADGSGRAIESFTIITTTPNELLAAVHNRMPVILRRDLEERWLDCEFENQAGLLELLQPYPAEEMEGYEVSRSVNSPLNNGPECVERLVSTAQMNLL